MQRLRGSVVLGALVALAATTTAHAQAFVFVGGGAGLPMSDYADLAKTGWVAQAGIGFDIGSKGLWADVEGMYGSNNHDVGTGNKSTLLGGLGVLGYSFSPAAKVSPYVLGGVGFLRHSIDLSTGADPSATTDFAYTGGAGLGFRLEPKILFYVEARYLGGDTQLLPIMAGLSITLGGN